MKVRDYLLADVLVVGGGIAGCRAAIEAAEYAASVILVDQDHIGGSSGEASLSACFAAAIPSVIIEDDWQQHARDTLSYGDGLGDPSLVAILTRDALRNAWEMERYHYYWARSEDGLFDPKKAPGHSFRRILRGSVENKFDTPGQALEAQVRSHVDIQVIEGVTITNLLQQQGRVVGAVGLEAESGDLYVMTAGGTILACGGIGSLFFQNARRGSGMGMAYRLGAEIIGPELQFVVSKGTPHTIASLGGLRIDDACRTTLPGLFAAGEITGGIHGRKILPGNGLADGMVFGAIAGREAALAHHPLPRIKEEGVKEEKSRLQKFLKGAGRRGSLKMTLTELHEKIISALTVLLEAPADKGEPILAELENYGSNWFRDLSRPTEEFSSTSLLKWVEMDYLLDLAVVVYKATQLRLQKGSPSMRVSGPASTNHNKFNVLAKHTQEGISLETIPNESGSANLAVTIPTHA